MMKRVLIALLALCTLGVEGSSRKMTKRSPATGKKHSVGVMNWSQAESRLSKALKNPKMTVEGIADYWIDFEASLPSFSGITDEQKNEKARMLNLVKAKFKAFDEKKVEKKKKKDQKPPKDDEEEEEEEEENGGNGDQPPAGVDVTKLETKEASVTKMNEITDEATFKTAYKAKKNPTDPQKEVLKKALADLEAIKANAITKQGLSADAMELADTDNKIAGIKKALGL